MENKASNPFLCHRKEIFGANATGNNDKLMGTTDSSFVVAD